MRRGSRPVANRLPDVVDHSGGGIAIQRAEPLAFHRPPWPRSPLALPSRVDGLDPPAAAVAVAEFERDHRYCRCPVLVPFWWPSRQSPPGNPCDREHRPPAPQYT
jgi:hypothetical protein